MVPVVLFLFLILVSVVLLAYAKGHNLALSMVVYIAQLVELK